MIRLTPLAVVLLACPCLAQAQTIIVQQSTAPVGQSNVLNLYTSGMGGLTVTGSVSQVTLGTLNQVGGSLTGATPSILPSQLLPVSGPGASLLQTVGTTLGVSNPAAFTIVNGNSISVSGGSIMNPLSMTSTSGQQSASGTVNSMSLAPSAGSSGPIIISQVIGQGGGVLSSTNAMAVSSLSGSAMIGVPASGTTQASVNSFNSSTLSTSGGAVTLTLDQNAANAGVLSSTTTNSLLSSSSGGAQSSATIGVTSANQLSGVSLNSIAAGTSFGLSAGGTQVAIP